MVKLYSVGAYAIKHREIMMTGLFKAFISQTIKSAADKASFLRLGYS